MRFLTAVMRLGDQQGRGPRTRAVDESGNQLSVFGRVGARPFNLEEQRQLYLRNGKVWQVSDDPAWEQYFNVFRQRRMTPPMPE